MRIAELGTKQLDWRTCNSFGLTTTLATIVAHFPLPDETAASRHADAAALRLALGMVRLTATARKWGCVLRDGVAVGRGVAGIQRKVGGISKGAAPAPLNRRSEVNGSGPPGGAPVAPLKPALGLYDKTQPEPRPACTSPTKQTCGCVSILPGFGDRHATAANSRSHLRCGCAVQRPSSGLLKALSNRRIAESQCGIAVPPIVVL